MNKICHLKSFPFSGGTKNKWIKKFRHGKCLKKMKRGCVPGVKGEGRCAALTKEVRFQ